MIELDHVGGKGEHLQLCDVQDICVGWVERVVPVVAFAETAQACCVVLGQLWRVSECVPYICTAGTDVIRLRVSPNAAVNVAAGEVSNLFPHLVHFAWR